MATKSIVITLTGEDMIVEAGFDAFARANGYTDESDVTKEEVATNGLKKYFREIVSQYNISMAQMQAANAAKAQSDGALNAITLNLVVE